MANCELWNQAKKRAGLKALSMRAQCQHSENCDGSNCQFVDDNQLPATVEGAVQSKLITIVEGHQRVDKFKKKWNL